MREQGGMIYIGMVVKVAESPALYVNGVGFVVVGDS